MVSRWCKPLSAVVLAPFLACEVQAADITLAPQVGSYAVPALSSASRTVRLTGPIKVGDAAKLRRLLDEDLASRTKPKGALVVAELNSELAITPRP